MCGSIVFTFVVYSLTLFVIMDNTRVFACSPPANRSRRSFRARANSAEIVVFATVVESPARSRHRMKGYYHAKLSVHCILKGPPMPRVIKVAGFGNDGGGCSRTNAVLHRSYIILLKKVGEDFILHNVEAAHAAKRAREKLLLRMLPDFWRTSHRPYRSLKKVNRFHHCPTLKKMKRFIRQSMRKYIRSKPRLSNKKEQLKTWLKEQRKQRKAAKNALKTDHITISTPLSNNVEAIDQYKSNKKLNGDDSFGVKQERSGLFKRSSTKIMVNKASFKRALNSAKAVSISFCSISFAWLVICLFPS